MVATNDTSNWVPEDQACPRCGERDADQLEWIEDGERVRCATCRTVYTPPRS